MNQTRVVKAPSDLVGLIYQSVIGSDTVMMKLFKTYALYGWVVEVSPSQYGGKSLSDDVQREDRVTTYSKYTDCDH